MAFIEAVVYVLGAGATEDEDPARADEDKGAGEGDVCGERVETGSASGPCLSDLADKKSLK